MARPDRAASARRISLVSARRVAEAAGWRAYRARSAAVAIRSSAAATAGSSRSFVVTRPARARGDSLADQLTR